MRGTDRSLPCTIRGSWIGRCLCIAMGVLWSFLCLFTYFGLEVTYFLQEDDTVAHVVGTLAFVLASSVGFVLVSWAFRQIVVYPDRLIVRSWPPLPSRTIRFSDITKVTSTTDFVKTEDGREVPVDFLEIHEAGKATSCRVSRMFWGQDVSFLYDVIPASRAADAEAEEVVKSRLQALSRVRRRGKLQ